MAKSPLLVSGSKSTHPSAETLLLRAESEQPLPLFPRPTGPACISLTQEKVKLSMLGLSPLQPRLDALSIQALTYGSPHLSILSKNFCSMDHSMDRSMDHRRSHT